MIFHYPGRIPTGNERSVAYIYNDGWDDWFTFQTTFILVVIDSRGQKHNIGTVKIGEVGRQSGRANIPSQFEVLPDQFFSLGQNESYYEAIEALPADTRSQLKKALRDIAIDLTLFDKFKNESIARMSLMRYISESTIMERFNKIATGTAQLTEYKFHYLSAIDEKSSSQYDLTFEVTPHSLPPSNIHVLIGRNGVGKTNCLINMVRSIMERDVSDPYGTFEFDSSTNSNRGFSGIVNVSFSAFDSNTIISPFSQSSIKYDYVGLCKEVEENGKIQRLTKGHEEINEEFKLSLAQCLTGPRKRRWLDAVKGLESDPIFQDSKISSVPLIGTEAVDEALRIFSRFSSGHKIILLTITKLIELVDERTLILLDEPEGHLHPPLLSAFIRSLSDLLITRNGVAIIATHSPVVLQEVPCNCVSIINRFGRETVIQRPEIETFGENIGILTREIFGLEVMQSGFHRLLELQSQNSKTYEEALGKFNGKIGAEAKSILRGMIARRSRG